MQRSEHCRAAGLQNDPLLAFAGRCMSDSFYDNDICALVCCGFPQGKGSTSGGEQPFWLMQGIVTIHSASLNVRCVWCKSVAFAHTAAGCKMDSDLCSRMLCVRHSGTITLVSDRICNQLVVSIPAFPCAHAAQSEHGTDREPSRIWKYVTCCASALASVR